MDFQISDSISGFQIEFHEFQIGFLDFKLDFGNSIGFLPIVYEISFVTDPSDHLAITFELIFSIVEKA